MASPSSGSSIPAPEAVQVLVLSLSDDSSIVREASMASLKDIASLNPLLVLECCAAVSRGGRRRFGNMAGVFQVMAFGVRALDGREVDNSFMANLAKIATAEIISSKALAISACTTLVSVEPKFTVETRNHGTSGFFAIPNNPVDVVNPLIDNLITLLCAILISSGENGRSQAELLLYILRQIDQFTSSPVEYQRKRGCLAVHEVLLQFRMILDQLFSISLLLPRPAASSISAEDIELSYSALSSLEDVIAILWNVSSSPHYVLGGGLGSLLELMVEALCRHVSDESSTVRRLCLRGLVQIPSIHILKYTTQVLGVILALLDDSDESVQLAALTCLMMFNNYHNALKGVCPFMEVEGLLPLLNKHSYLSDHRSDYERFLREFTKQFTQHIPSRIDSCLASTVQAFDVPWPLIQANAIYFSSSMLCLSDNQQNLALYHTQVFGMLLSKLSLSPDAVVRATSSAALGLLLKSSNFCSWTAAARFDRAELGQRNHDSMYAKH
ncbi:hypothetical protein L6164_009717 [Bauhinia variegata]|uniref:Uncharacterized protein n=1 Tax=Bauhinia variegata TaxID=167791 RepID=A0ACB9PKU5_BAUVA|nr:hypothetical protein L6164_009717 [Bauhinia variegata]